MRRHGYRVFAVNPREKEIFGEPSYANLRDVPEPIDIITLLHDVLRGVKKLWWACLLLTVLCAAGSWYTAKRAYRPLYRAAASFTVATGSGESGGFSYGFYYNTATASQLARTFPYILESELLTDSIKQALGTDYITASLSASTVEDSNLFTLTATGANAESTLKVLDAAIECYPEAARYVDGSGAPVELPGPGGDRRAVKVEHDGSPVGAIIHDGTEQDRAASLRALIGTTA